MEPRYYIGLDVHKRKISYCVKDSGGRVFAEGLLSATRLDPDLWMKTLPQPWSAAMEATMFTGWIYAPAGCGSAACAAVREKAGYFRELLASNPDIDEGLRALLRLCRETVVRLQKTESALVRSLESAALLVDRVERLFSAPHSPQ